MMRGLAMNDEDYLNGALIGSIITMIASLMIFVAIRDLGRGECEQDLPRAQQCELKWVKPESAKK